MTIPPNPLLELHIAKWPRASDVDVAMSGPVAPHTPEVAVGTGADPPGKLPCALALIDLRIVESSPSEALQWLAVRQEIVKQDDNARDRQHLRLMEKWSLAGKLALSAIAVASGVGLAFGGFGYPAFICLGAGLYNLAPEFMNVVTKRLHSGDRQ